MKEENVSNVRLSKTSIALLKRLVQDEGKRVRNKADESGEEVPMKQQIDLQILSDALDGEM